MTEKRFQYNVNKNCIEYDGKFVAYLNSVDGFRIANHWNTLYKENGQLKHKLQQQEMEYATDLHRLAEKNDELRKEILWWKYRCGEDISGDVE